MNSSHSFPFRPLKTMSDASAKIDKTSRELRLRSPRHHCVKAMTHVQYLSSRYLVSSFTIVSRRISVQGGGRVGTCTYLSHVHCIKARTRASWIGAGLTATTRESPGPPVNGLGLNNLFLFLETIGYQLPDSHGLSPATPSTTATGRFKVEPSRFFH